MEPRAERATRRPDEPAGAGPPYSWRGFLLYFLRLGSLGFGGPIALAGFMRRDLVEARWREGRSSMGRRSSSRACRSRLLVKFKKLPEPALIVAAGVFGVLWCR